MLVPVDWLKDYVEFNVSIDELSHSLTMAGLNVENIIRQGENISKVVTGKIVEKKLHPNAERLHICKVDVGKDTILEVITGADNINKGNIVPVALPGAKLPNNNIIKTTNIRGKESQGMMCS
ncbi:MAG TPA: phenylalanine--tRNA ligase subunit beta, partial [Thermoanaerobacterales bacterium]|nr:phenylalanine--tRNA ligase subunit beta [Thermoanaerobacterales bacterium]